MGDLLNLNSFELLHVSPAILLNGFITAILNMVLRWHYRFQLFNLARSTAVMKDHENAIEQIFGFQRVSNGSSRVPIYHPLEFNWHTFGRCWYSHSKGTSNIFIANASGYGDTSSKDTFQWAQALSEFQVLPKERNGFLDFFLYQAPPVLRGAQKNDDPKIRGWEKWAPNLPFHLAPLKKVFQV